MAGPYHALTTDMAVPHHALTTDTAGPYHALSADWPILQHTAAPIPSAISQAHRKLSATTQMLRPAHRHKPAVRSNPHVTLNNPTLRIFGPNNLRRPIDPDIVAPALQLLSHLLLSPAALRFIYTVVFTPAYPIPKKAIKYSVSAAGSFEFRDEPGQLTPDQSAQAIQALDRLADGIRIELHDAGPGRWGRTRWPWKDDRALISFSQDVYMGLAVAAGKERWDDHAWLTVQLATILLHEFGHAIVHLSKGRGEFYFPSAPGPAAAVAEEGYELQRRVLGGSLWRIERQQRKAFTWSRAQDLVCDTPASRIILYQWPAPSMISAYIKSRSSIGVRRGGVAMGKQRPTQPVVPFAWVRDVLREEFWERLEADDEKALWPVCGEEIKASIGFGGGKARWRRVVGEVVRGLRFGV